MIAKRAFVLLLLASCGGREERAPVSRPSPSAAPSTAAAPASAPTQADAGAPVAPAPLASAATFSVRSSDVLVTGGLGYVKDRYRHPSDPKPGEKVEIVRAACTARGQPQEEKRYACAGATKPASPEGEPFLRRAAQCFDVKTRAATPAEAARLTAALEERKEVDVPRGQILAFEIRFIQQRPETSSIPCRGTSHQPCDPATFETGRMLDASSTQAGAIGPDHSDATNPYFGWRLNWIDVSPAPANIEGAPKVVRAAVLFDRAVEIAGSKDLTRLAVAVKALEDEVGHFEDRSLQPIADAVSRDLPTLRAIVAGRATIGDACIR